MLTNYSYACIKPDNSDMQVEGIFSFERIAKALDDNDHSKGYASAIAWFINTENSVCFDDIGDLNKIQLVLPKDFKSNKLMTAGKKYEVFGKFSQANTPEYITKVVILVDKINAL